MLLFVAQDGLMKAMIGDFPIWVLMGVRGVVALFILGLLIVILGPPHRLLTPLWPIHLLRATLFGLGFSLFYTAFPFMNLAEVSTIFFSAPLMIGFFAAFFLGERVGVHRIVALVVGFIGVIIAMNPQPEAFRWVSLLPLLCAVCYSLSQILARRIGDRETTLTAGLYTIVMSSMLVVPFGWVLNQFVDVGPGLNHLRWHAPSPTLNNALGFSLLGLVGMGGYLLISRAYQVTSASLVAPFDYTYLPFATLMAYLVWNEVPKTTTLVGMSLIAISGLYLGFRELSNNRNRVDPLPVAEATVAPGNPTASISLHADIKAK